jgi:hypothetical protein
VPTDAPPPSHWEPFASLILEAAYESTMWGAILNARQGTSNIALLTLLGGCAFGNSEDWILSAIRRALEMTSGFDIDIKLVSYGARPPLILQIAEDFFNASAGKVGPVG